MAEQTTPPPASEPIPNTRAVIEGLNTRVTSRLSAMRRALLAGYEGGSELSNSSKGSEREAFIHEILAKVFPQSYRFGSGDITSYNDMASGQVDIVVESPHWFSFPLTASGRNRLYLAEGVAAAIEVKSNLQGQWDEVKETVKKVKRVMRRYEGQHFKGWESVLEVIKDSVAKLSNPELQKQIDDLLSQLEQHSSHARIVRDDIPCYAIGYTGWKTISSFESAYRDFGLLDGAVILDKPFGIFRGVRKMNADGTDSGIEPQIRVEEGEWVIVTLLESIVSDVGQIAAPDMPVQANYGLGFIQSLFTDTENAIQRLPALLARMNAETG